MLQGSQDNVSSLTLTLHASVAPSTGRRQKAALFLFDRQAPLPCAVCCLLSSAEHCGIGPFKVQGTKLCYTA